MWERARWQWRLGQGGDPLAALAAFLAGHGLGLPRRAPAGAAHTDAEICGATLFISAAAGATMIGAPPGSSSPCPAVPDIVAVVHAHTGQSTPARAGRPRPPAPAPRHDYPAWRLGPWRASWTPAAHAHAVGRVREAIAAGDVYQTNLVAHFHATYQGDPVPALHRLTALPGARYPAVLAGEGWAVACASPETLLRIDGATVRTGPIKGTRPATTTGRAELLASVKERAEHIMIVDMARNDLSHVAAIGSVRVPELFAVGRWCDLWQAESAITARLRPDADLAAVLRAVCPGASVTGAPKIAALRQIAALEPTGRGASMGALGWLDTDHLDLGLTIRTVAVDTDRVHLWAGGGITWDSDPDAEVAEAHAKAAPIRAALAG